MAYEEVENMVIGNKIRGFLFVSPLSTLPHTQGKKKPYTETNLVGLVTKNVFFFYFSIRKE